MESLKENFVNFVEYKRVHGWVPTHDEEKKIIELTDAFEKGTINLENIYQDRFGIIENYVVYLYHINQQ
jgi:hypothetical protein